MAQLAKILIATTNPGKVREFREMLGEDRFEWSDLSQYPGVVAPEETGQTFQENSALKAIYYATKLGLAAMADDSGLEVDALGGKPGIHSARWAEITNAGHGDRDNNRLLLKQLANVPIEHRTARFVCALTLADKNGNIVLSTTDKIEGRMLDCERGAHGFGYDPLFLVESLGRTTAELQPQEKHRISHRGKALQRMRLMLEKLDSAALS